MGKKFDKLFIKCAQEFYYINRVLESCDTMEQLMNTQSWINKIFGIWGFRFSKLSFSEYGNKYSFMVRDVKDILQTNLEKKANVLKAQQEQQKKKIVIKGFK
jgi:hypothetical protein